MTNFKAALFLVAMATISLSSTAQAEPNEKFVKKKFNKIDTSADISIDLEEYMAFRTRRGNTNTKAITRQFERAAGDDNLMSIEEFASTVKIKKGGKKKKKK